MRTSPGRSSASRGSTIASGAATAPTAPASRRRRRRPPGGQFACPYPTRLNDNISALSGIARRFTPWIDPSECPIASTRLGEFAAARESRQDLSGRLGGDTVVARVRHDVLLGRLVDGRHRVADDLTPTPRVRLAPPRGRPPRRRRRRLSPTLRGTRGRRFPTRRRRARAPRRGRVRRTPRSSRFFASSAARASRAASRSSDSKNRLSFVV